MTVPKEETNNGVALLLERMETHPEEFVLGQKWGRIMQEMHKYASKEDSEALNTKLKGIMLQSLTEQILEELVDPKDGVSLYNMAHPRGTGLGGATLGQYSSGGGGGGLTLTSNGGGGGTGLTWSAATSSTLNTNTLQVGNQTLDQETIEHMKAHLEWLKREEQLKKQALSNKAGAKNLLQNIFGGNK